MKENLQMYNYTVSHVKGVKNYLADVFSRTPVWLAPDNTLGPDHGLDLDKEDNFGFIHYPHFIPFTPHPSSRSRS